jgi:hypothetical protein
MVRVSSPGELSGCLDKGQFESIYFDDGKRIE